MTGSIENFFFAWGAPDDRRDAIVTEAVTDGVIYRDPKGEVTGARDLCLYVAEYSANAPGAAAEVVEETGEGSTRQVRVRFFGEGWEQFGRYEVTLDDHARIARLDGVAETGA